MEGWGRGGWARYEGSEGEEALAGSTSADGGELRFAVQSSSNIRDHFWSLMEHQMELSSLEISPFHGMHDEIKSGAGYSHAAVLL